MRTTRIPTWIVPALVAAAAMPATAADWTVDAPRSAIAFRATQFGHPFQGRFGRFSARISFEPGARPTGSVRVAIDVASLGSGEGERDGQARGPAWFAAATAPRAVFAADRFRRVAPDRYVADGTLTIRNATRPASLPFTLTVTGDRAAMRGALKVDRLAFGLGAEVPETTVGREVVVTVAVEATRASARK